MQCLIGTALSAVSVSVAAVSNKRELYLHFLESSEEPESLLEKMSLVRSMPDKVLRAVKRRASASSSGGGMRILIPADAATALVLRTGMKDDPSLEELKALASQ